MKNKLSKVICLMLTAAFLLSCFAVYSFADDAEVEEPESTTTLLLNRTFDEGWDETNGLGMTKKAQSFDIVYEENYDFSYNYFLRCTVNEDTGSSTSGHFELKFPNMLSGGAVLELDVKTDCVADLGRLTYYLTTGSSSTRTYVVGWGINDNNLYTSEGANDLGGSTTEWLHLATVFNFDQDDMYCNSCKTQFRKGEENCASDCSEFDPRCLVRIRNYVGAKEIFDHENAINVKDLGEGDVVDVTSGTYCIDKFVAMKAGQASTMYCARIGFATVSAGMAGMSYCVDNVLFYSDASPVDENGNPCAMDIIDGMDDVDKWGYGSLVNENKTKTIAIKGSDANTRDYLGEGIIMKVGCEYMLRGNKRLPIFVNSETGEAYGAPRKVNGIIYVPLEVILNTTGYPVFLHDDGISYDISTASGSSTFTIGRDTAVVNGKRVNLTGPTMLLQDPKNPDNTYPVIAMDDVSKFFQGYYVDYDEMGLMAITETEEVFDRASDLKTMLTIMKKFIFDIVEIDEDTLYGMLKESTNNFDHPYILADEEQFKLMNDVWEGRVDDSFYRSWLEKWVTDADNYLTRFTTLPKKPANHTFKVRANERNPEKYKLLAFEINNPFSGIMEGQIFTDIKDYTYVSPPDENGECWPSYTGGTNNGPHYNDGYDWAGSRNSYPASYSGYLLTLALAYRITNNMDYAEIAYDIMISMCDDVNWPNWSHAHFLTTGGMLNTLGPAYDWLYDAWDEIEETRGEAYRLDYITQTIYEKTIYYGYDVSRYGKASDIWTRDEYGVTTTWNWSHSEINWNAVCSSGLVIGSMAIVGESERLGTNYKSAKSDPDVDRVKWCMRNNLWNLMNYGLAQYAPDGSYIESASYWSYATNYLAELFRAVEKAFGDDLGLFNTWGMDKTFYFAIQVEYSEYKNGGYGFNTWAYHDSGGGSQETNLFFFASQFLEDDALAAIRMDQIKNGKKVTWEDVIGYKPEYKDMTIEDVTLSLDWELEACDGVVARSSWDKASTFIGVMGGKNNFGNHAHMDSGIFTYVDDGFAWFPDIGSDEYNIYQYFEYGVRQHYYRMSTEGHNLVTITSLPKELPFGQVYNGGGKIEKIHSEGERGMYAVLDNSGAYGNTIVNYARRGMLFTNSRETVVFQDEIAFKGVQSCAWIAHTSADIMLSADGKTAFLTKQVGGRVETVRLTLYSDTPKFRFKIMTCGIGEDDFIFDATIRPGWSVANGQRPEKSRSNYKRLVIEATNTLSFNVAVVIEDVEHISDTSPVRYDYTTIAKWALSDSYAGDILGGGGSGDNDDNVITTAKMTDITTYTKQALKYYEANYAFSTRTYDYFRALAKVTVAVNTYRPESFKNIEAINNAYKTYLNHIAMYNGYRADINGSYKHSVVIGDGLSMMR